MPPTTHAEDFTGSVPAILVFGDLMKAKAFKDQAPRYKANFLYPLGHPDIETIKEIVLGLCRAAYPGREVASLGLPFKSGERINADRAAKGKKPYPFYDGHYVLSTQKPEKTRAGAILAPPRLVVLQNKEYVPYLDENRPAAARFFYNGVKVVPRLQFSTYEGFNGGITVYLQTVMSLGVGDHIQIGPDDDETFGGAERYDSYTGGASNENPLAPAGGANPW